MKLHAKLYREGTRRPYAQCGNEDDITKIENFIYSNIMKEIVKNDPNNLRVIIDINIKEQESD